MVAQIDIGKGEALNDQRTKEQRIAEFEKQFLELASKEGTIQDMFQVATDALLNAEMTIRAPDLENGGWNYKWHPDHAVRLAAFEKLAKVLRLMPTGGSSVTVNATQNTLNISAEERVAELKAVGVGDEELKSGCLAILEATNKSQAMPIPSQS